MLVLHDDGECVAVMIAVQGKHLIDHCRFACRHDFSCVRLDRLGKDPGKGAVFPGSRLALRRLRGGELFSALAEQPEQADPNGAPEGEPGQSAAAALSSVRYRTGRTQARAELPLRLQ